jgi:hypothetical protein
VLVLVFVGAVTVKGTVPARTVWGGGVLLKNISFVRSSQSTLLTQSMWR